MADAGNTSASAPPIVVEVQPAPVVVEQVVVDPQPAAPPEPVEAAIPAPQLANQPVPVPVTQSEGS
jgi:hypothetical protein